jgi:hypothetical protein
MQWFQDLVGGFAILFLAGSILASAAALIFSTLAVFFIKNPNSTPQAPGRPSPSVWQGDPDHHDE